MPADFTIELIKDQTSLQRLADRVGQVSVIAVDIETINWWNRHRERVALIQIAYRAEQRKIKVTVIDALAALEFEPLRIPLESPPVTKVIHNAAFDATKLAKHFRFKTSPIFDTMLAARRSGEAKYSLAAQALTHLGLHLDKGAQRSDWSRRPLDGKQLAYAALDAAATLQLYEHQQNRQLNGAYRLKNPADSAQIDLPLAETAETSAPLPVPIFPRNTAEENRQPAPNNPRSETGDQRTGNNRFGQASEQRSEKCKSNEKDSAINPLLPILPLHPPAKLALPSLALLGIVSKLPGRYGPEQLAVSVGADRVGLAGWIVDRTLGGAADFDETEARMEIANLFERSLIKLSVTGRLEPTREGEEIWERSKTI